MYVTCFRLKKDMDEWAEWVCVMRNVEDTALIKVSVCIIITPLPKKKSLFKEVAAAAKVKKSIEVSKSWDPCSTFSSQALHVPDKPNRPPLVKIGPHDGCQNVSGVGLRIIVKHSFRLFS
ncbi:hypothetical protein LR48_Vigan503s002500 [Vigna angularis]|uniref:Uncharacterized protein n=1 Tax=Phaseolus angularis TaxID=3914 RepID=A0A0L9TC04_PHAAN|nr:hypothetical protein LR48_Vigan503s002500 [Vigna angularis]